MGWSASIVIFNASSDGDLLFQCFSLLVLGIDSLRVRGKSKRFSLDT